MTEINRLPPGGTAALLARRAQEEKKQEPSDGAEPKKETQGWLAKAASAGRAIGNSASGLQEKLDSGINAAEKAVDGQGAGWKAAHVGASFVGGVAKGLSATVTGLGQLPNPDFWVGLGKAAMDPVGTVKSIGHQSGKAISENAGDVAGQVAGFALPLIGLAKLASLGRAAGVATETEKVAAGVAQTAKGAQAANGTAVAAADAGKGAAAATATGTDAMQAAKVATTATRAESELGTELAANRRVAELKADIAKRAGVARAPDELMADLARANPKNPWAEGLRTLKNAEEIQTVVEDFAKQAPKLLDGYTPEAAQRAAMDNLRANLLLRDHPMESSAAWRTSIDDVSKAIQATPARSEGKLLADIKKLDPNKTGTQGLESVVNEQEMHVVIREALNDAESASPALTPEQARAAAVENLRAFVNGRGAGNVISGTEKGWTQVLDKASGEIEAARSTAWAKAAEEGTAAAKSGVPRSPEQIFHTVRRASPLDPAAAAVTSLAHPEEISRAVQELTRRAPEMLGGRTTEGAQRAVLQRLNEQLGLGRNAPGTEAAWRNAIDNAGATITRDVARSPETLMADLSSLGGAKFIAGLETVVDPAEMRTMLQAAMEEADKAFPGAAATQQAREQGLKFLREQAGRTTLMPGTQGDWNAAFDQLATQLAGRSEAEVMAALKASNPIGAPYGAILEGVGTLTHPREIERFVQSVMTHAQDFYPGQQLAEAQAAAMKQLRFQAVEHAANSAMANTGHIWRRVIEGFAPK
jgi:hypothetical protein